MVLNGLVHLFKAQLSQSVVQCLRGFTYLNHAIRPPPSQDRKGIPSAFPARHGRFYSPAFPPQQARPIQQDTAEYPDRRQKTMHLKWASKFYRRLQPDLG